MKTLVFGSRGMLGRYVEVACHERGWDVDAPGRDICDVTNPLGVAATVLAVHPEVIINCAGLIPARQALPGATVQVNGAAPHYIAEVAERMRIRMVHVSTDCVYDSVPPAGAQGPMMRTTTAPTAPRDLYGRSKLAGEPVETMNTVSVRTSFIGPTHGLWPWALEHAGQEVEGWERAYWSGSTVDAVANGLLDIAEAGAVGVLHLATEQAVPKASVLLTLAQVLGFELHVNVVEEPVIDRSMRPTDELGVLPPLTQALAGARTVAP